MQLCTAVLDLKHIHALEISMQRQESCSIVYTDGALKFKSGTNSLPSLLRKLKLTP